MLIASDSERTSASARSFDNFSPLQLFDHSYVGASDISPVFVARRRLRDLTQEPVEQFSGRRGAYDAHVMINSPSTTSLITAGGGRRRYTFYGSENLGPIQLEWSSRSRVAITASELDASILHVWVSGSILEHQSIAETIASLRNIVAAIESRSPVRLSDETETLVQQAAQAHGTPQDIAAWARRLAEDVRDLSD
jgi:hypothetical protein